MKPDQDGISMRFTKEWDIVLDPNPSAKSWVACPTCSAICVGVGRSLSASMENANKILAEHQRGHAQRTGDEPI